MNRSKVPRQRAGAMWLPTRSRDMCFSSQGLIPA
jgi:hypothetical protein